MDLLKQLRELKGLTREELAEKTGLSTRDLELAEAGPGCFVRWRKGQWPIPTIAVALGIETVIHERSSITEMEQFLINTVREIKRLGGEARGYTHIK